MLRKRLQSVHANTCKPRPPWVFAILRRAAAGITCRHKRKRAAATFQPPHALSSPQFSKGFRIPPNQSSAQSFPWLRVLRLGVGKHRNKWNHLRNGTSAARAGSSVLPGAHNRRHMHRDDAFGKPVAEAYRFNLGTLFAD
jgi:hypothetical protein